MDRELVREIIKYIAINKSRNITLPNYKKEDINKAISELLKQGVITEGTVQLVADSSMIQNRKIGKGTTIPINPNAKMIEIYNVNISALKKYYGMDQYGINTK